MPFSDKWDAHVKEGSTLHKQIKLGHWGQRLANGVVRMHTHPSIWSPFPRENSSISFLWPGFSPQVPMFVLAAVEIKLQFPTCLAIFVFMGSTLQQPHRSFVPNCSYVRSAGEKLKKKKRRK